MEHGVGGLAAQGVVARHHHLPQTGHPADGDRRADVVRQRRHLPGPPGAHGEAQCRDPLAVDLGQGREEGRRALVLPRHESGRGGAEVEQVAREGLLPLVDESGAVAPAEGVDSEHRVAASGEFVADEASVEVPVRPGPRRGQFRLVVPGPDEFLLADVELRAVVVQQEHRRERSPALREEHRRPHSAETCQVDVDDPPTETLLRPFVDGLGVERGVVRRVDEAFLDRGAGRSAPGGEVPDRGRAPGEREGQLLLEPFVKGREVVAQHGRGLEGRRSEGRGFGGGVGWRRSRRPGGGGPLACVRHVCALHRGTAGC